MSDSRGFVLIVVLWIVAILALIALSFGHRAILDRKAAAYSLDHTQAQYMARGAVLRGIAEIRNKSAVDRANKQQGRTSFEQGWNSPPDLLGEEGYFDDPGATEQQSGGMQSGPSALTSEEKPPAETEEKPAAEFEEKPTEEANATAPPSESPNGAAPAQSSSGGAGAKKSEETCTYSITDADSKLSVNFAPEELLEEIDGISFQTVNEILDQRSTSSKEGNAAPFLAIEQVRNIKGVTDEMWFGTEDKPGLKDILAIWGDGKININTASKAVMHCIPEIDDEKIDAIVAGRPYSLLEQAADKVELTGSDITQIRKYCKLDSGYFTITGYATQRKGKIAARCEATVKAGRQQTILLDWREYPFGQ